MSDWTLDFIERNPITTQEHIKELEAENAKLKALVEAQENYIHWPFTQEASHMAHAKKELAAPAKSKAHDVPVRFEDSGIPF
jgi:hypothetical protein